MSTLLTKDDVEKQVKIQGRVEKVNTIKAKMRYVDIGVSSSILVYGVYAQSTLWIVLGIASVALALLNPAKFVEKFIKTKISKSA